VKRAAFASRLLCGLFALGVSLEPGAAHAKPHRPAKREAAKKEAAEEPKPRPERRDARSSSDSSARVIFVTSEHAYLNRGRSNGLPVERGETLVLTRGKIRTRCQVEFVGESTATCVGEGVAVGDRFEVGQPRTAQAKPVAPPLPEAELRHRLEVLHSKPPPLVKYQGEASNVAWSGATVVVQDSFWHVASGGDFHQEWLEAALRFDNLPLGFRANADFNVLVWSQRPSEARPTPNRASFILTTAELLSPEEHGFSFAVGRTWPTYGPGMTMIDGVSASWQFDDHLRELGVFSGFLPDPLNQFPTTRQATTGVYFMQQWRGQRNQDPMARWESRVAWVAKPFEAPRLELGSALHAMAGQSSADLQALGGVDGPAGAQLDGAWLDLRTRLFDALTLHGGARYQRAYLGDVLELGDPVRGAHSVSADTGAYLDVGHLSLSGYGRAVRDLDTRLEQLQFGGELALVHLFGAGSRLGLGHQEERGWLPGRTAYLQMIIHPGGITTWMLRASASQLLSPGALPEYEAGLYLSGEVRLNDIFWLRLTGLGRADVLREIPPRPYGYQLTASLGATL
jgi:hypothetical protein